MSRKQQIPDATLRLVDWSKSNAELMAELRISRTTLARYRGRFAAGQRPLRSYSKRPARWKVDWAKIDWTDGKSDKERARELGVVAATVASWRAAAGRANAPTAAREAFVARLRGFGLGVVPDAAVAAAAKVSRQRIHQIRKQLKIPAPPKNNRGRTYSVFVPQELIGRLKVAAAAEKCSIADLISRAIAEAHPPRIASLST